MVAAPVVAGSTSGRRLPAPLTPLIGRERELREIAALLADDATRVVSLLGPGGVGKTRLAVAIAEEQESAEPGSVLFVSAAHVRSGWALVSEIARIAGVPDGPDDELMAAVTAALQQGTHLVIVDNLEQIPDAGVEIAALLRSCPGVTLLVTSRTPLRISGERRVSVAPLPSEDPDGVPAAVRLFLDRANAISPFAITESNRDTVRAICRRLDGLPLAIELAAARTRSLSLDALAARISQRLTLLSGGNVDLPERHRTLHATIAWSYELLREEERRAFRRLSAIPAGFGLELASVVLDRNEDVALGLLDALIDHSLLSVLAGNGDDIRFGMLQTIRDFALEQSAAEDEAAQAYAALAGYMRAKSGTLRAGLESGEAAVWRAWCRRERPNAAAAIDWLVDNEQSAEAIDIVNAFWRFWYDDGLYREGIATMERVLANLPGEGDLPPGDLARVHNGLGALYFALDLYGQAEEAYARAEWLWKAADDLAGLARTTNNRALLAQARGDLAAAISGFERAIEIVEALGDERRLASAQDNLGITLEEAGEHDRAADLHARALAIARRLGDERLMATSSRHLASALASLGDINGAIDRAEEARELWEQIGIRHELAYTLNTLGTFLDRKGDKAGAERRYRQAFEIWEELEEPRGIALALHNLAACGLARGESAVALGQLRRSLAIRLSRGNPRDLAFTFAGFSDLALAGGDPERATRLYAFSWALFTSIGIERSVSDNRPELRRALGKARFDTAWKTGTAMTLDDAVAETERISAAPREAMPSPVSEAAASPSPAVLSRATIRDHGLTERELDVLRQVAAGKTNAEIGEALFISAFTAKTHVANLLGKLGVESRAAASTWAAQHGLL